MTWERNPENEAESIKEYIIYSREVGGEFSIYQTVDASVFSADFLVVDLSKKIQFGISTVYSYETESDIALVGAQRALSERLQNRAANSTRR